MTTEHGARWLDARYEREFARGHLDGAVNLPLPLLRLQYGRLDPDANYIVYSDDPACSAVAAFLLRARGVDARYVNNVVDVPRFDERPVSSTSSVTPPAHPLQESTMYNDAPSVLTGPEDLAASTPEAPEHYADTYTGQSLAKLVEEIHTSGIIATDENALDNAVIADEAPRIALDDTLFRLHNDDPDDTIAEPAPVPIAAPAADDSAGTVDALTQALSDFEHRMRAQLETVRLEERARHERRFAERVGLMQKRAEELLREKLLQARARDRERLAERERHLDEMHARLAGLANKVTHQKARIQEARRQIADKLAAVESMHRELNNLGRSMTEQIDDLEGLIPYDASRTPE